MLVDNNKLATTKNAGELLAISIAMWMQQFDVGTSSNRAHPGLHLEPLDAAIGQVPAPYCPGGHHGQQIH
jgi:hypothetical protein